MNATAGGLVIFLLSSFLIFVVLVGPWHGPPPCAGFTIRRPQTFTSEPEGIFKDLEKTALNPFIEAKDSAHGTASQGKSDDKQRQESWQQQMGERWARALYSYYNWRTVGICWSYCALLSNTRVKLASSLHEWTLVQ